MSLSYPSVILSSIHFSSILSAKTCANVAGSDHFGPSCCLVQIQAASQVITETSLTEKHNTAHLSRKLRMFPGWFFFAKKKRKKAIVGISSSFPCQHQIWNIAVAAVLVACCISLCLQLCQKVNLSKLSIRLPVPFPPCNEGSA